MSEKHFYNMIKSLRENEEAILYTNRLNISTSEQELVNDFLHKEYKSEMENAPHKAPKYDGDTALWAAQLVYVSAQLILYRKDNDNVLADILPSFDGEINPSTLLSADLCLRFLPEMLLALKNMDSNDQLVDLLENILIKWHYSSLNYPLELNKLNFEPVFENACFEQLYLNRVVEYKNIRISKHPKINSALKASFGLYRMAFWNEFTLINEDE